MNQSRFWWHSFYSCHLSSVSGHFLPLEGSIDQYLQWKRIHLIHNTNSVFSFSHSAMNFTYWCVYIFGILIIFIVLMLALDTWCWCHRRSGISHWTNHWAHRWPIWRRQKGKSTTHCKVSLALIETTDIINQWVYFSYLIQIPVYNGPLFPIICWL